MLHSRAWRTRTFPATHSAAGGCPTRFGCLALRMNARLDAGISRSNDRMGSGAGARPAVLSRSVTISCGRRSRDAVANGGVSGPSALVTGCERTVSSAPEAVSAFLSPGGRLLAACGGHPAADRAGGRSSAGAGSESVARHSEQRLRKCRKGVGTCWTVTTKRPDPFGCALRVSQRGNCAIARSRQCHSYLTVLFSSRHVNYHRCAVRVARPQRRQHANRNALFAPRR